MTPEERIHIAAEAIVDQLAEGIMGDMTNWQPTGIRVVTESEWTAANNRNRAMIRLHPLFHQLVREVAVAEQPNHPRYDYLRRNSLSYGMWCTRGMPSLPNRSRRARYFAQEIAKDLFFEYWERMPGDATAMVYVTARDNVRARMR